MPLIKHLKQHTILLDTHIWIWVMTADPILKSTFRKEFEAILKTRDVLISPISVWEVGMLIEKKRINIEMDVQEWVDKALETRGFKLVPISARIAIQSTRLPGIVHGDPADRLLIATACEESAVLVTCDEKLLHYGEDKLISVHNPC